MKKIVFVGGGHSNALVLKKMGMSSHSGLHVTLVSPFTMTPYSGMLPSYITGDYRFDEVHIDLRQLCTFGGVKYIQDEAVNIDIQKQKLFLKNHPEVDYDILSIDTGSTPDISNILGVEFAYPVKPVSYFLDSLENFSYNIRSKPTEKLIQIAIIGAGIGGLEIALAMKTRMERLNCNFEISILHKGKEPAEKNNKELRKIVLELLKDKNIKFYANQNVNRITPIRNTFNIQNFQRVKIFCDSGFSIESDFIIRTTNASAPDWIVRTGLKTNDRGFILVRNSLQSVNVENIFAAGDIASLETNEHPKSGVYAVRHAPFLYENIFRYIKKQKLKEYLPQRNFLVLMNTGDRQSIATKGRWSFGPYPFLYKMKDSIDVSFMKKFKNLPPAMMKMKPVSGEVFKCNGCASKVSSLVLQKVLSRLQLENINQDSEPPSLFSKIEKIFNSTINSPSSSQVVLGMHDGDDSSIIKIPKGKNLVQTIDFFKLILKDSYLSGKILAHHALNDIYAVGGIPDSALTLLNMPFENERVLEEEMYHLMRGINDVFLEENCRLLGGHTSESSDYMAGLSCNGFVDEGKEIRKSEAQEGDILILTKPLGTGLIFAAEMRNRANGKWIDKAINKMLQSNKKAMEIFQLHQVRACTDISGFGLIGHLATILKASKKRAYLQLSDIRVLDGVEEILEIYPVIDSSFFPANLMTYDGFVENQLSPSVKKTRILYDPQTSGGLLGVVPQELANSCLKMLTENRYDAFVFGKLKKGKPGVVVE